MSVSYKYCYDFFMRNTFETKEKAVEKMRKKPTFMWKEEQLCTIRVTNNEKKIKYE